MFEAPPPLPLPPSPLTTPHLCISPQNFSFQKANSKSPYNLALGESLGFSPLTALKWMTVWGDNGEVKVVPYKR